MRNPSSSSSSSPTEQTRGNVKTPCCTKEGLKRGPWTPEEDELLSNYIKREGEGRWRTLPKSAGLLRCGKSCRLRWMNYLRPSVKRGQIDPDEEDLILRLHRLLGNRWSLIAGRIPGRTDNEIKNYWNTHLSKKLISQGIDPRTHKPLNLDSSPDAIKAPSSSSSKPNNYCNISPTGPDESPQKSTNRLLENPENNSIDPHLDQIHQIQTETLNGSLMTLRNNTSGTNDAGEDINYCSEDVLSSFLNSLIEEDALINHQQSLHLQLHGISAVPPEPLLGFRFGWDQSMLVPPGSDHRADRSHEHQRTNGA